MRGMSAHRRIKANLRDQRVGGCVGLSATGVCHIEWSRVERVGCWMLAGCRLGHSVEGTTTEEQQGEAATTTRDEG